jgi:transaldolase
MKLYIDSAKIDEIKEALSLGYVEGITTNPTLLKVAEIWKDYKSIKSFYSKLLDLCDGEIFVQIPSVNPQKVLDELENLDRSRLVIKIPSVPSGVQVAKDLIDRGYYVCATAVYAPSQAIAWASIDVDYIAIYFNRMELSGINALENTKTILNLLSKTRTKVLAASVKTLEQLNSLVSAGVDYVTVGHDLLQQLMNSENSLKDTKVFDADMLKVLKEFSK